LKAFQQMFETRRMHKVYIAAVKGVPNKDEWICRLPLGPEGTGKMRVAPRAAFNSETTKDAETHFKLLEKGQGTSLIEARPVTGRTHQIRVHLAAEGYPVLGDQLYGAGDGGDRDWPLALRAIHLSYSDPFTGRNIHIDAPAGDFIKAFGFIRAMNKPA
jgi:tRNA pseudouridine32 synthase / 23S rRNA pseudouridine746 synthase